MRLLEVLTKEISAKLYLQRFTENSINEFLYNNGNDEKINMDQQNAKLLAKTVVDFMLNNELISEEALQKFEGCKG